MEKTMGTLKKIFILHGWTYSIEKWKLFIECMKAHGYDSVQFHIPGLTEETDKVWTVEDYVEWLSEKLGKEKVILIGHSNGGRIALAFAAQYPQRLKKLILIDSAGIYHRGILIRFKRFIFKELARIGKKITSSPILQKILYTVARERDYYNASPLMKQTMVHMISTDLTPKLQHITVPTLLIWGKNDKSTPLSDGKIMHTHIKHSKLYVIDEAKHSPHFTHPKEVCEKIVKELQNV